MTRKQASEPRNPGDWMQATGQPLLARPRVLTPAHRLTWCALNRARYLADLLEPGDNARRREIQARIVAACHSGDLRATLEAMKAGRGWVKSTPEWTGWCDAWVAQVERDILSEVRQSQRNPENRGNPAGRLAAA